MAQADREADLFSIPDFGQTSHWLQQVNQDERPTFFATDLDALLGAAGPMTSAGGAPSGSSLGFATFDAISLEQDGFFKLPSPDLALARQPNTQTAPQDGMTVPASPKAPQDAEDAWIGTHRPSDERVGFRTWETFVSGDFAEHQPMFTSEAGPAAYDALLRRCTDPSEFRNSDAAVVEASTYNKCLLALALGRDSVLFRKDNGLLSFQPVLPKFRISGFSQQVLQGVQGQAVECGTCFLQLGAFIKRAYAAQSSRSEVALASCILQVLQAVEQRLAVDGTKPCSLLQLQASIREILSALAPLRSLVSRLRPGSEDQVIVSTLFHTACSLDDGQGFVRAVMREILRRVSGPWIQLLEEWIGTRREEGIPLSRSHVGEAKGFIKVEAATFVDDLGLEVQDVDFQLDYSKVPDFMSADVVESMFETGRNLRFIRSFHLNHPLAQQAVIESMQPPKAEWLYDWTSILRLEARIARYRDSLCEALRARRRDSWSRVRDAQVFAPETNSMTKLDFFGVDQDDMEARMLAYIKQLDEPVAGPQGDDSLHKILREHLFDADDGDVDQADATPHWSLLSVLSFGGFASVHGQVVNRESLRLLFDAQNIRGQLRLQRDFHLLGNGMFCSRLSHALFDPDLTSAERQAGIARQGGVMGLRLGGRDTWPPASSELRLVLMGVLRESCTAQNSGSASLGGPDTDTGHLSFAVRDLSGEEIDECMNSDSLEALDFLRLSYKTPPELSAIITPIHLMHYDRIFKLLLRVLRMQYVTNHQCLSGKAQAGGRPSRSNASLRFSREAYHFVSSVAAYFWDVGVAVPWQMFEQRIGLVRAGLEDDRAEASAASPGDLREAHSQVLGRIMSALFLRKRQQLVLKLLEELFSIVLRHAKQARLEARGGDGAVGGGEAAEFYAKFKKMQAFVTVCRALSEKGGGRAHEELGVGADGLVAQLLMKLDMGNFYVKQ